jgi:ABC-type oligopeptide transport system substrate-binding subunit
MAMRDCRIKKRASALLTAALCCTALTACGDSSSTAEHPADSYDSQPEIVTETTRRTEISTTDSAAGTTTETVTETGLIDRAESALDSIGEAVTSILREGTKEVHPLD